MALLCFAALPAAGQSPETEALAEAARLIGGDITEPVGDSPPIYLVSKGLFGSITERTFLARLVGPHDTPDNWQLPAEDHETIEEVTAPWGGTVTQHWSPYRDVGASQGYVMDSEGDPMAMDSPPMEAYLRWSWRYPQYRADAWMGFSIDEETVTVSQAVALLTPLAEALHRGMVAQGLTGGTAPAAGPDRVRIAVTTAEADPRTGQVRITGTVASRSPITSASFFRAEGGTPASCHIEHDGGSFTASCEFVAGERNVFKIVFDNEARLSAEQTFDYDATGTMTGQQTTSETGDVTVPVPPPPTVTTPVVPGLGPVGNLPGPRNMVEGVVGVLAPGLVGLLTGLFGGLFGNGPGSAPPVAPPPPPRRKTRKRKGDDQPETEEDEPEKEDKKKPYTRRKKRRREREPTPPDKAEKPDKENEKEPEKDKDKAPPGPDAATKGAETLLDRLEKKARTMKSPEVKQAVEEARKNSFGPDGTLDPEAWAEQRKKIRSALDGFTGRPSEEGSVYEEFSKLMQDSLEEFRYQVPREIKKTVVAVGEGIGTLVVGAYEGFKAIGDAIWNHEHFREGLKIRANRWMDRNAPEAPKQFQKAMKDGRYLDALGVYVKTNARMAFDAGKHVAAPFVHMAGEIARTMLPIDEINSFFDPHASLEEKLWAIPSAITRTMITLVTTVPKVLFKPVRWPTFGSRPPAPPPKIPPPARAPRRPPAASSVADDTGAAGAGAADDAMNAADEAASTRAPKKKPAPPAEPAPDLPDEAAAADDALGAADDAADDAAGAADDAAETADDARRAQTSNKAREPAPDAPTDMAHETHRLDDVEEYVASNPDEAADYFINMDESRVQQALKDNVLSPGETQEGLKSAHVYSTPSGSGPAGYTYPQTHVVRIPKQHCVEALRLHKGQFIDSAGNVIQVPPDTVVMMPNPKGTGNALMYVDATGTPTTSIPLTKMQRWVDGVGFLDFVPSP